MQSSRDMSCGDVRKRVTAYLDGALTARERARFEGHTKICPRCRLHVEHWQAMVESLRRLKIPQGDATGEEKERLVALFHEHGFHRPGRPSPRVPLGFDGQLAAPGDHIALFCESERNYTATVGFVAAGAAQGETCVLLGHGEANARLETELTRAGVDADALRRQGRLWLLAGANSADALLEELGERVRFAVDRGSPLIRILGNLGWGRPGWPDDADLLRLEARVTDAVRRWPVVVMCSYDVRTIPSRNLVLGGLECHPLTCRRNVVRPNELYIPTESFLATLLQELD